MPAWKSKYVLIFLLLTGFLSLAAADELVYNVTGEPTNHTTHGFVFENQSEITSPQLYIVDPVGREKTFELSNKDGKLETDVPSRFFSSKGVYRFNFLENGERIVTPGEQSLILGAANKTWKNRLTSLAGNNSENGDCDDNTYLCFNEYYQSKSINSDIKAFRSTGNSTYLEKAVNYSLANWTEITNYACGDFNCDEFDGRETTAAMRQGAAINSLWIAYTATGNSEIKQKAVNYTEGAPTSCNVNNNDFDCGNATNQAYMMQGFWTAYKVTNNTEYREKAANLTAEAENQSYDSPKIVSALTTAYQATGNSTYKDRIYSYYRQNSQEDGNWTELKNVKSGLEAYRVTGNNYFYRNPINPAENLSVDCLTNTSANCYSTDQQADALVLAALMYVSKKDQRERFVNPVLEERPSRDQSLQIQPEMKGSVKDPVLNVYDSKGVLEDSCSLNNINNSCSISFSTFEQGIYTAELESENSTYSRRIPVSYSQRDLSAEQKLLNLTRSSPENNCNPWNNSFSCVKDDERFQAFYIQGFTDVVNSYRNETYMNILGSLSSSPYSFVNNSNAECLPENNDFSCTGFDSVDAGERQGSLIESLYSSYQATGNVSYLDLAQNYSSNSTEEGCRVWQDEFTCSSPEAQGLMIQGYWEAYEVTGNSSYRNVSLELANHSDFSVESPELSAAFWETYAWTNSTEHMEKAVNMTDDVINTTDCPSCGTENLLDYGNMLLSAYRTTSNSTYQTELESQQDNVSDICSDGNCSTPLLQGKAISFTARTMNTLPVTIDVETSMDVSPTNLQVEEQATATCEITNTMQETSTGPIDISILPDSSFNESEMNTTSSSLDYNQTANYTENVTAVEAGEGIVECRFSSPDFTVEKSSTITIEEVVQEEKDTEQDKTDSTEDDGRSGEGGGGFTGGEESQRNNTVVYPKASDINWNRSLLNRLGINTTYKNFTQRNECFRSVRKIRGQNTVLEVDSSCTGDGAVLVDRIPSNVSLEKGRRVEDMAVAKTPELKNSTRLSLNYTGLNTTNFMNPLVLKYSFSLPPININFSAANNQSAVISADLSREQSCTVYHEGEQVRSEETAKLVFQPSLEPGNNTYRVECGDQTFTRTFTEKETIVRPNEKQRGGLPLSWMAAIALVALSGLALRRREEIIGEVKMKIFEYRFNRFEKAVEQGNTAEAIEAFDSMSRDISQEVLESDMDLMQGLMLYLLIDLVEEGKDDEVNFGVSDDLDELVQRYVNGSGGKTVRLVREKYEEATGREM